MRKLLYLVLYTMILSERAVRKLDGVVNQNVNLATEKLTVLLQRIYSIS